MKITRKANKLLINNFNETLGDAAISSLKNDDKSVIYIVESQEDLNLIVNDISLSSILEEKLIDNILYIKGHIKIHLLSLDNLEHFYETNKNNKEIMDKIHNVKFYKFIKNKVYSEYNRSFIYDLPKEYIHFVKNVSCLNSEIKYLAEFEMFVSNESVNSSLGTCLFINRVRVLSREKPIEIEVSSDSIKVEYK